ncbi:tRNA (guanosine(37)-N1)-methyltransferase TrmD, partial [Candidatus Gracilibacteria bacterium]|nr:tRNA (guanosine(37)-N1)-methyltransferase TrmD [Candidatus Gracilibacteria bacterium]
RGDSDPWPNSLISREADDLLAAVAMRSERVPNAQIGVVGFSMGAAVTIMAAAQEPRIAAVVADSSFTAVRDVIANGLRKRWRLPAEPLISMADELLRRRHGYRFKAVRRSIMWRRSRRAAADHPRWRRQAHPGKPRPGAFMRRQASRKSCGSAPMSSTAGPTSSTVLHTSSELYSFSIGILQHTDTSEKKLLYDKAARCPIGQHPLMQFDILTLFPAMFSGPMTESILKRAQQAGLITINTHDIRSWALDRHRTADDTPYGGGAGMVMKAEPLAAAIRAVLVEASAPEPPVIYLTPDGARFDQSTAQQLAQHQQLVLICGHYEGIDERVRESLVSYEISIGDYVLTGGELAAMVVVDAVARLVPGVLDAESIVEESHSDGLLEYPHYTRPAIWEGRNIPPVLTSGHHGEVAKWRRRQRLLRTLQRRPDLLHSAYADGKFDKHDLAYLAELGWEGKRTGEPGHLRTWQHRNRYIVNDA